MGDEGETWLYSKVDVDYLNHHMVSDEKFTIDIKYFNKIFYCIFAVGSTSDRPLRIPLWRIYIECIASVVSKYTNFSSFVNNVIFTSIEIYYSFYCILLLVSMESCTFLRAFRFHKRNLPQDRFHRFQILVSKLSSQSIAWFQWIWHWNRDSDF